MGEQTRPQFRQRELHVNAAAPVRHFIPEAQVTEEQLPNIPQDRFGNRVFASADKAYLDRLGNETKAALLVSAEGESLIRSHPGILSGIDAALHRLDSNRAERASVITRNNRHIGTISLYTDLGSQSDVYLLHLGPETYVIKKHRQDQTTKENGRQPYINEMLQAQSLAADLHDQFVQAGIVMPTFLFASGQLSCTRFEEGSEPRPRHLKAPLSTLLPQVNAYIAQKQREGDPLWSKIKLDSSGRQTRFSSLEDMLRNLRTSNFIKRKDGKIVWIDPFYFEPSS